MLEEHPEQLKSSTKNSSPWLTFRDYRQFRETECFRTWKFFESMPLMSKIEFLWTAAKFYHPIEEGNDYITTIFERRWMEKTHINVQRIHGAQKSERFKTTRIDWRRSRNWSQCWMLELLKVLTCIVLKCKYHRWVLQNAPYGFSWVVVKKDLWTKFIVTTLKLWMTVHCCARRKRISKMWVSILSKLASGNGGHGSDDSDIVKSNDKPSSEPRETAISTTLATLSRSRRSHCAFTLLSERDPKGRQNLGHYSQMPEVQKQFFWDSHLQMRHTWFDTVINMNEKKMVRCIGTSYVERKIPKSSGYGIQQTRIGSIAFILEASRRVLKSVKMRMEKWSIFGRSRDIQVESLFHQNWWITW